MNLRFLRKGILLCGLVLLVGFQGAFALTLRQTSLEELTNTSDLVVLGKVTDVRYEWAQPGSKVIYTVLTIDVSEYVKGDIQANLIVRQLGGQIGEFGYRVDGTPGFSTSDEVVFFLQAFKGSYWIHSIALGAYNVMTEATGEKFVLNDLRDINILAENSERIPVTEAYTWQPMNDFINQVKSYTAQ